jgi:hypothetical protein
MQFGRGFCLDNDELLPRYEETDRQIGVSGLGGNPAYPAANDSPLPVNFKSLCHIPTADRATRKSSANLAPYGRCISALRCVGHQLPKDWTRYDDVDSVITD